MSSRSRSDECATTMSGEDAKRLREKYRRITGHAPARGAVASIVSGFAGVGFGTLVSSTSLTALGQVHWIDVGQALMHRRLTSLWADVVSTNPKSPWPDARLVIVTLCIDMCVTLATISFIFAAVSTYTAVDKVSTFPTETQNALNADESANESATVLCAVKRTLEDAYSTYDNGTDFLTFGIVVSLLSMILIASRVHLLLAALTIIAFVGGVVRNKGRHKVIKVIKAIKVGVRSRVTRGTAWRAPQIPRHARDDARAFQLICENAVPLIMYEGRPLLLIMHRNAFRNSEEDEEAGRRE